jgi:hypothetical protein
VGTIGHWQAVQPLLQPCQQHGQYLSVVCCLSVRIAVEHNRGRCGLGLVHGIHAQQKGVRV